MVWWGNVIIVIKYPIGFVWNLAIGTPIKRDLNTQMRKPCLAERAMG
jgi:hypothetical protein